MVSHLHKSNVLKAHPVLPIVALGTSVIGSAGLGWSGDIDLLGGGDTDCMPPFPDIIPAPNPETSEINKIFKLMHKIIIKIIIKINRVCF